VWAKARQDLWFTFFKKDACGASIEKDGFGKETEYGWEIDHIVPVSKAAPITSTISSRCTGRIMCIREMSIRVGSAKSRMRR